MSLKRKAKVNESFSMASMTDVIFLLLIFFMVTSTLIVPNAIKVTLPASQQQAPPEVPPVRVIITQDLRYFVAFGQNEGSEILPDELEATLSKYATSAKDNPFLAIYADETVPYKEVVKVINIASPLGMKVVLVTRPLANN